MTDDVVAWALSCDWHDYEDVTQYKSALAVGADCIITWTGKDYQQATIPVYSVKELVYLVFLSIG